MSRWRDDPALVKPMLASLDEPPLEQHGLVFEPKYDGIRALADVRPASGPGKTPVVAIYSRNGHDKHAQFPAIVAALQKLARHLPGPVLLDGEIVAIDPAGRPMGFQHIQGRIHLRSAGDIREAEAAQPTVLVCFDLLRDGDEDIRGLPLAARRLRLQERVGSARRRGPLLRLSEMAVDDGREMLTRARHEGWEGLIVKTGSSPYHSGRRTPAWRKLKLQNEQEFVVGGWTDPRDTRSHFGALIVGYQDTRGLRWAGSVGTGFDEKELERLARLLKTRSVKASPFVDKVSTMSPPHWVRPELVAQVRFTEWTSDGLLRHPVYLGLRADKPASEVTRDSAARASEAPKVPKPRGYPKRGSVRAGVTMAPAQVSAIGAVVARLSALEDSKKDGDLTLPNGDTLRVTNLAKVFWPDLGITKGELLRYYAQVSSLILPVVGDRPLVMKRFPNGVVKQAFYQQRHPEAAPAGVRREVLPEDVEPIGEDGPRDRLIGGSITTLLYMTQLAAISQDPWFSRVADPFHQDHAAIDLDPGEDVPFARVVDVALWVKEELDRHQIPAFPKTSGASGLHIYIPLPPKTTYETGQLLCQMIATAVSTRHPKVATVERMVKRRPKGTVYVDYLQNILGKTLATAYSARASEYAGVSTPLRWDEVGAALDPRDFTVRTALSRFAETGDLWAELRQGRPVNLKRIVSHS